jgi:hypothetical protein
MSYEHDRAWSDRFIAEIRAIVGPYLLVPSPLEVDRKQAADLIVLRARDMTVAARVRRPGYFERYPTQFTIRSRRTNGAKTELAKLLEGWGDWMFYGHADDSEEAIGYWMLIDLDAWRRDLLMSSYHRGWKERCETRTNGDGSTEFVAFDATTFAPGVVIGTNIETIRAAA